jgi:hypothetical protein
VHAAPPHDSLFSTQRLVVGQERRQKRERLNEKNRQPYKNQSYCGAYRPYWITIKNSIGRSA